MQPSAPKTGPYVNVVVIGDSLSAGFQNDSLLDTQQVNGWASLVATQAKFPLQLPLIGAPGAPAVLQLLSVGSPVVIEAELGTTTGRDNIDVQPYNLSVPGQTLHQLINLAPTESPTGGIEILTDLILGAPLGNSLPQLGEAVALKPTTVFLWIGANDALPADEYGNPAAMTSLAKFTSDYTQLMTTLRQTKAHLVVANIPDITILPYMTKGIVILSEGAKATGFSSEIVSKLLAVQAGDILNAQGVSDFENELRAFDKSKTLTPLATSDVLTAAEIVTTQKMITSYNKVIATQVAAAGGTLVDLHSYFATLLNGVTINGYKATTGFLGGLFSLDGVHPTNTGYALLANQYITVTNTAFKSSTPAVNVSEVAAKDPYFGPNIKPASAAVEHISAVAAQRTSQMLRWQ